MNKSSKLLHLDPFAVALEKRKEREAEALKTQSENVARHTDIETASHNVEPMARQNPYELTRHTENNAAIPFPQTSTRQETEDQPSHTEGILPRHLYEDTPSHTQQVAARHNTSQRSSKLETKESSFLETPKTRKLDTAKPRKLDTKKPVSSHTSDRHKTRDGQVNIQPDVELLKEIKHFLVDHGMSMKELFENATRHYMDDVSSHLEKGVSRDLVHDDLIIYKTHEDIIMLYRNYTSNRWKPHDDQVGKEHNGTDRRMIELGIINTLFNFKGRRINSFKYFLPEIEELQMVKLGDETLDIMLKRRREQWEQKKREGK